MKILRSRRSSKSPPEPRSSTTGPPDPSRRYTVLTGSESPERDPVCGMTVDRSNLTDSFGDTVYYFCSENCLERFRSNPVHFVRPIAAA